MEANFLYVFFTTAAIFKDILTRTSSFLCHVALLGFMVHVHCHWFSWNILLVLPLVMINTLSPIYQDYIPSAIAKPIIPSDQCHSVALDYPTYYQ